MGKKGVCWVHSGSRYICAIALVPRRIYPDLLEFRGFDGEGSIFVAYDPAHDISFQYLLMRQMLVSQHHGPDIWGLFLCLLLGRRSIGPVL